MKASKQNRGMALLVVLVIVALLTSLVTELAFSTLIDLRLTETFRDTTRAYYLAKGGINAGRMILQNDGNAYDGLDEPWSQGVVNYPVGSGSVTVRIADQDGKLGINALVTGDSPQTIMVDRMYRLFVALQLDDIGNPAELTAALIDWLDSGDTPYTTLRSSGEELAVTGAETAYYQGLSAPYSAKNRDLETLEELARIKGFTPEVLRRVTPHIALHRQTAVNINTASAAVLRALDPIMDETSATSILDYRRRSPIVRLEQLEDILPDEVYGALKTLGNLKLLTVRSNFYRIESDAAVNDGRRRLVAEVDKTGNQLLFFKVD